MAILDRMSRLIRANINDLIDRAEDPEKMLNELMREMETTSAKRAFRSPT